jgi:predicted NAD-dependent protein-ADP-ribosyltransferase YbiA (DUF1768 family)
LSQDVKNEIEEALKCKGYAATPVYGGDLFVDQTMTAGNIKAIADILRAHGYVDKDWEGKRIKIMINLLLQKFSSEELSTRLQETSGKTLIEGNTWGDTLWGVTDGVGRNILGLILMEIRKLMTEEVAAV